ncbi:MAG: glycosyltransferase family 9 protein [Thermomicrobiales bacterium]
MIDPRWRAARRVLAVRLDNLGDVLLMTPALHAIKETLPEATLTLLTSPVGAQAGRLDPDVDDVIVCEAPWVDPWQQLPHDSERERRLIAALRARRFDAAVIFTSYRQSALPAAYLCYLADIPLRLAASIDGPGSLLTSRHRHPDRPLHEVERSLDLVGAVGCTTCQRDLILRVPEEARADVAARLSTLGLDGYPLVVVHPGCSMPARTYPAEGYAAIVTELVEQLGAAVVLTGTAAEQPLLDTIWLQLGAAVRQQSCAFAGALSFAEFCALIASADLAVTNNTGPMHIAAAVKTPVVALFALTNPPGQWAPWRVPYRLLNRDVPCRICYHRVCPYTHDCLRRVTPQIAVAAAAELLAETRPETHRPLATWQHNGVGLFAQESW